MKQLYKIWYGEITGRWQLSVKSPWGGDQWKILHHSADYEAILKKKAELEGMEK